MAVLPQTYDLNELLFPGDSGAPLTYGTVGPDTGITVSSSTDVPLVKGATDNTINVSILGDTSALPNTNNFTVTAISPDQTTSVRLPIDNIQPTDQPNTFRISPGLPSDFKDGSQVVVNYLDAESNSLPVGDGAYPSLPPYQANQASEELVGLYTQAGSALSAAGGGGQSSPGSLLGDLAASGKVPIEAKDDILRKEPLRGAAKEAVSRYNGLTNLLNGSHKADEMLKLRLWLTGLGVGDLSVASEIGEYSTTLAYSMSRLGFIMKKYDFTNKGSVVVQSSNAYNSSAQSHRFNSGTVFDIYAPTTMINTEYLIQQSSSATFRQTGIDQLSCFYQWHRAEDAMVNQTKNLYNYATHQVVNGGNALNEVYNVATYKYLDGVDVRIGGFSLSSLGSSIGGESDESGNEEEALTTDDGMSGPASAGAAGGATSVDDGMSGPASARAGAGAVAGAGAGAVAGAVEDGMNGPASMQEGLEGEVPVDGEETLEPLEPVKANYTLSATGNVNLFSLLGRLLVKAKESVLALATDIVLDATKDIFIRAAEKLALESTDNLNITCRDGQLILDAKEIIFRSPQPIQFYIGEGPTYMQESIVGLTQVENPDLMRLPELFVTTVEDLAPIDDISGEVGEAIGVEGPPEDLAGIDDVSAGGGTPIGVEGPPEVMGPEPLGSIDSIPAEGAIPIEVEEPPTEEIETEGPLIKYAVVVEQSPEPTPGFITTPYSLLDYPKSPLPAPVAQPNNGIVTSPIYPAS
jgi:hypothetical protein